MSEMSFPQKTVFHIGLGFGLFGMLIGYITGLTSSEISNSIMLALFSFLGSKFFVDITKSDSIKSKISAVAIGWFSILFLIMLNVGIIVKVNQVFSFRKSITTSIYKGNVNDSIASGESYLRSSGINRGLAYRIEHHELTAADIDTLAIEYLKRH